MPTGTRRARRKRDLVTFSRFHPSSGGGGHRTRYRDVEVAYLVRRQVTRFPPETHWGLTRLKTRDLETTRPVWEKVDYGSSYPSVSGSEGWEKDHPSTSIL